MITISDEEWQAHQQQMEAMQQQIADLLLQLAAAQQRIAELERKKTSPPAFVKANVPEHPEPVRKRRAPEHNQARRREPPTDVVRHPITQCPACQGRLSGLHVGRRRQVIEVPPPPPVQIVEPCGWCSYCHRWQEAAVDLTGHVVGQGTVRGAAGGPDHADADGAAHADTPDSDLVAAGAWGCDECRRDQRSATAGRPAGPAAGRTDPRDDSSQCGGQCR